MSNYQFVDCVGVHSIANIIRQSGLVKMSIQKYGMPRGTMPIFEDLQSKTNDRIVKCFTDWANTIQQGNPYNDTVYELTLFNDVDLDPEQDESEAKKGYGKKNKMRFAFQLFRAGSNQHENKVTGAGSGAGSGVEIGQLEILIAKLIDEKINKRFAEIEERIEDIEADIDEIGEIGEQDNGKNEQMLDRLLGILDKSTATKKTPANATINGIERDKKEVLENINKAVKILYKHDPELDLHLLKLADLAENNKPVFNTVISKLDLL